MKLSIIIPVFNEKGTVKTLLEKVRMVDLPGIEKEIIVVDGCSTDGTKEILMDICSKENIQLIIEERRQGKGMALRRGFKEATGDIFLIQDGDLESDPNEYPRLLMPIIEGKTGVVYGSRFKNGRGLTPFGSYIGNQTVTWFMNFLFLVRLSDVATVYKVFRRELVENLNFECKGFDFDIEITAKIIKNKNKIIEVPISYYPRKVKEGKKLHWVIGFRVLCLIVKYRFL